MPGRAGRSSSGASALAFLKLQQATIAAGFAQKLQRHQALTPFIRQSAPGSVPAPPTASGAGSAALPLPGGGKGPLQPGDGLLKALKWVVRLTPLMLHLLCS